MRTEIASKVRWDVEDSPGWPYVHFKQPRKTPIKYTVIVEKGESSYGAFVPDLPGCIAVGEDREQTLRLIEEAVAFHVEGLRAEGLPVSPPQCDIA